MPPFSRRAGGLTKRQPPALPSAHEPHHPTTTARAPARRGGGSLRSLMTHSFSTPSHARRWPPHRRLTLRRCRSQPFRRLRAGGGGGAVFRPPTSTPNRTSASRADPRRARERRPLVVIAIVVFGGCSPVRRSPDVPGGWLRRRGRGAVVNRRSGAVFRPGGRDLNLWPLHPPRRRRSARWGGRDRSRRLAECDPSSGC
jgi:hypothetical protein